MFLRKTSRFKDGKRHDYWSVAENARAGSRVVQRQLQVMPGNTSDKGTQVQFVERLVKKYGHGGKLDSLWLMDRGVPTEGSARRCPGTS